MEIIKGDRTKIVLITLGGRNDVKVRMPIEQFKFRERLIEHNARILDNL
jgi:hypothetical protein